MREPQWKTAHTVSILPKAANTLSRGKSLFDTLKEFSYGSFEELHQFWKNDDSESNDYVLIKNNSNSESSTEPIISKSELDKQIIDESLSDEKLTCSSMPESIERP